MNDVQILLREMQIRGWTSTAIAEELGVTNITVYNWQSGSRYPENKREVLNELDQLMKRPNIPSSN